MSEKAPYEPESIPLAVRLAEQCAGSRRNFLLASMGVVLAGCGKTTQRVTSMLPGPAWDARPAPSTAGASGEFHPLLAEPGAASSSSPAYARGRLPAGRTMARSEWASGRPVPTLMQPMRPVRYVTIHHDGMTPFFGNTAREAAARLDAIRIGHRREQWGDIGYHFAVDRAGNVWSARPLQYQGAHVKNHNEGNIGIVALGNFEQQQPTSAQLEALRRQVTTLMRTYRVPVERIRTHQEWASTACPGRNLQRFVTDARRDRMFG